MRNELTIVAIELPQLLSKCRKQLPENLKNEETKMRKRHVHLLTDQRPGDFLRLRSEILKCLRQHLSAEGFVDVQTPILADAAGGAVARPFHTSATEFSDRQLALRIAPELWLKRLIVGGFEKIYEIGPSFRNEGTTFDPMEDLADTDRHRSKPQPRVLDVRVLQDVRRFR